MLRRNREIADAATAASWPGSANDGPDNRHRRGFALVVVLAFVVLLTFLLIAFLSRSLSKQQVLTSSVAQTRANQLATQAIEVVTGNLRQEILAGSAADKQFNVSIYNPRSNRSIVPAFAYSTNSSAAPPPSVLKRSASGVPFFPGGNVPGYDGTTYQPSSYASAVGTEEPSYNGRSISKRRWNAPCLLDPAIVNGSNPAASFLAPDWIIVTRNGPKAYAAWDDDLKNSDPANGNFAIGRFAYVIYDEGGLLDINVAGNILASGKNSRRGRLHQADLSQIPGLAGLDIESFLKWRGALTGANESATPRQGGLFDPDRDFIKVWSSPAGSDQTFLNRQDLITYARQHPDQFGSDLSSLQYLGTFSREKNAPSFTSTLLAGTNNAVKNPALTKPRFAQDGTLADGTRVTKGMPLLRKRFSLGRLAWITARGPSADLPTEDPQYNADGTAANILLYFGLQAVGSGTYKTWAYRPNGNSPASSILTLAQVGALNPPRDPDFFEMLKASILQGSLGQSYSSDGVNNSSLRDGNTDLHIMQIGANLLTQYCSDGLPTIISFTNTRLSSSASDYNFMNVRGVASLPYIYQLGVLVYRPVSVNPKPDGSNPRPNVAGWLVPRLWNPHQWLTSPNQSRKLRLVAVGGAWTWSLGGDAPPAPIVFKPDAGNSSITFHDSDIPSASRESVFSEPAFIPPANVISSPENGGLTAFCDESSPAYPTYKVGGVPTGTTQAAGTPLRFTGIPFGIVKCPDYRIGSTGTSANGSGARITMSGPTTLELQYSPDGVTFFPYQRFDVFSGFGAGTRDEKGILYYSPPNYNISFGMSGKSFTVGGATVNLVPTIQSGYLIDPRTTRLGMGMVANGTPSASPWFGPNPWYQTQQTGAALVLNPLSLWYNRPQGANGSGSYTPGIVTGPNDPTPVPFFPGYYSVNYSSQIPQPPSPSPAPPSPITSQSTYYTDPDGIPRRGDGDQANDVHPTYTAASPYAGATGSENSTFSQAAPSNRSIPRVEDRPLILNRAFRSVGDMGYTSRDVPWKTLNFFSADSADAGLLDAFSLDDSPVVAGRVNLNTRQPAVLKAVLAGALRSEYSGVAGGSEDTIDAQDAADISDFIVAQTTGSSGPLMNRSELATRIVGSQAFPLARSGGASDYIKARREATVRALGEAGQTRTWNLLIDVIAQTGRYPVGIKSSTPQALSKFLVEGERRYWIHLAIDRFTGEIVDEQIEAVHE